MERKNFLKNKNILITGATGSVGSALVKKLLKSNCKVIRAFSNDENGLFDLSNVMNKKIKPSSSFTRKMQKIRLRLLHGDVREYKRCLTATKNIDIVIHAAAMKHVAICEFNPTEANKTNVYGTQNMIRASKKNKVKKFLYISTDKVVDPKSTLGQTKLLAEKMVMRSNFLSDGKKTTFSSVRFGNILGSRGSVVPKFINQIKMGIPITVTDKKMTRFVMTTNNSVDLIIDALAEMNGKEIFILNSMGYFKIYDLAVALLKYFNVKKKIKITGKIKGEKIIEKLYTDKESTILKRTNNLYVIDYSLSNKKKRITKKNNIPIKVFTKKEIISLLKKENLLSTTLS